MARSILFIAKRGHAYGSYSSHHTSSGLRNSAKFVVEMLREHGIRAHYVEVTDNNDIDREVSHFKPDVVIIEALWVVPEKFDVLRPLHPHVEWIVRIHSEIPFLSQEGVAMEWIFRYLEKPKVHVSFNSKRTFRDFKKLVHSHKILFQPNFFPIVNQPRHKHHKLPLDVGCFGAVRPLKNMLTQAVAAIEYAESVGKILRFHINSTRVEQKGEPVLKNLRSLFVNTEHRLVEHRWHNHHEFQHLLASMDLSMCVSFTESFCIVAADAVSLGVPLVCSPEIRWASQFSYAEPTDVISILEAMTRVLTHPTTAGFLNRLGLRMYDHESVRVWLDFARKH